VKRKVRIVITGKGDFMKKRARERKQNQYPFNIIEHMCCMTPTAPHQL
jgi:hypothetical protein